MVNNGLEKNNITISINSEGKKFIKHYYRGNYAVDDSNVIAVREATYKIKRNLTIASIDSFISELLKARVKVTYSKDDYFYYVSLVQSIKLLDDGKFFDIRLHKEAINLIRFVYEI